VPITATLSPAVTAAVLTTAPKPVIAPQARSRGAVERDVARDHDGLRCVDDDLLGEGRSAKPL
jgi:hypothetical protein